MKIAVVVKYGRRGKKMIVFRKKRNISEGKKKPKKAMTDMKRN